MPAGVKHIEEVLTVSTVTEKGNPMTAVTPIRAAQEPRKEPGPQTGPGPRRDHVPRPVAAKLPAGPPSGRTGQRTVGAPEVPAPDEASEIRAITRGAVQAAMEVLAGIRPIHQLARRLDPRCLTTLQHRAALIRREATRTGNPVLARLHRNSTVGSVRVCKVSEGIYEASAVVVDDVRARAVAVRLERSRQVWRVTELVIG